MFRCSYTLNYLSNKVRIPHKTEDLNLSVFNMITGINASKTLTEYISCKCKCKKCNSDQNWNNNKCRCECRKSKEPNSYMKDYIWNPTTCSCENGKYVGSIVDDSLIMSDKITKKRKINLKNFK